MHFNALSSPSFSTDCTSEFIKQAQGSSKPVTHEAVHKPSRVESFSRWRQDGYPAVKNFYENDSMNTVDGGTASSRSAAIALIEKPQKNGDE